MSTEKQAPLEAEAAKTEGQALAERLEKPGTKQALVDRLSKRSVAERARDFVANPPESSFSSKEFTNDETLKGKKMEVQVKTKLNVRNADGKVSASGKPGETFVLTGETTKDGRFVGIEGGNGEKRFVAASYLKDVKADREQTAPDTTAAEKAKESPSVPTDVPTPDSKEDMGGLRSTEPGKPIVTQEGNYEGQYRMTNGKPVFEGRGKASKDGLSFEGAFKNGMPAGLGKITSGKQIIEADFEGFSIKEGPGKITFDGSVKEGAFKYEKTVRTEGTPTGGTETTTATKITFNSEGITYRTNPGTSQFEAESAEQVAEVPKAPSDTGKSGVEKLSEAERTGREIVSNGEALKQDLAVIKSKAKPWNISSTADSASARVKDYLDTSEPKFQTLSKDKAGLSQRTRSDITSQLEELTKLAKMAEGSSLVPEKTKQEVRHYSQRIESMKTNVS